MKDKFVHAVTDRGLLLSVRAGNLLRYVITKQTPGRYYTSSQRSGITSVLPEIVEVGDGGDPT